MSTTPLARLKSAIAEAASLDALRRALAPLAAELAIVYDEGDVYLASGGRSRYAIVTFAAPLSAEREPMMTG